MCCKEDYKLNAKQFLFCQEYIKQNFNGTKAYMEVYKQTNEKTACECASRLARNDNVKACIEKMISEIKFDKQAIINQCIAIKLQIASGQAKQKRIDRDTGKVIEFTATPKDMNDATESLLKLFGAYETTTNANEEADVENMETSQNNGDNVQVEGFDGNE